MQISQNSREKLKVWEGLASLLCPGGVIKKPYLADYLFKCDSVNLSGTFLCHSPRARLHPPGPNALGRHSLSGQTTFQRQGHLATNHRKVSEVWAARSLKQKVVNSATNQPKFLLHWQKDYCNLQVKSFSKSEYLFSLTLSKYNLHSVITLL